MGVWTKDELDFARDMIAPVEGILCPPPHWAERHAKVGEIELGAQLPTRDGRRTGNAVVVSFLPHPKLGEVFLLVTDAGNEMIYTREEIKGGFYPPMFIMRRAEWPKKRERL